MKIIDKTTGNSSKEWGYGTVLKCWHSDPKKFSLFKISRDREGVDDYRLDILRDQSGNEDTAWSQCYPDIPYLKEELDNFFEHVIRVKATITIENFEGEQNEDNR